MSATVVLDLPDPVAAQVDSFAARAGMTPSSWLAEQIAHAFGTGMVRETVDTPRRTHRGRRSRKAVARRSRPTPTET